MNNLEALKVALEAVEDAKHQQNRRLDCFEYSDGYMYDAMYDHLEQLMEAEKALETMIANLEGPMP